MLPDAGRIQEYDTARRNRRQDRAGEEPFEPIFTEHDGTQAALHACAVPLETWFEPVPGIRARLWNAGHILGRSEEHTSEFQSLMRISYAVFCLKKKNNKLTENMPTQVQQSNGTAT